MKLSYQFSKYKERYLIERSYICVLVLSTLPLFIRFSDYIWELFWLYGIFAFYFIVSANMSEHSASRNVDFLGLLQKS